MNPFKLYIYFRFLSNLPRRFVAGSRGWYTSDVATAVPNIQIQKRDIEFLQLLLHSRILTLKHAAILLFGGSKEAAKKRIQKLKSNGLVLERRRKTYEQGVLFLSKQGFECLRRHGALPPECADISSFSKRAAISELTLQHELEVLDVKTAFYRDIKKHPNSLSPSFRLGLGYMNSPSKTTNMAEARS